MWLLPSVSDGRSFVTNHHCCPAKNHKSYELTLLLIRHLGSSQRANTPRLHSTADSPLCSHELISDFLKHFRRNKLHKELLFQTYAHPPCSCSLNDYRKCLRNRRLTFRAKLLHPGIYLLNTASR